MSGASLPKTFRMIDNRFIFCYQSTVVCHDYGEMFSIGEHLLIKFEEATGRFSHEYINMLRKFDLNLSFRKQCGNICQ